MDNGNVREELVRKYRLAGAIRVISFSLLLCFLLLMKWVGGYSYLNTALLSLILVEALCNQPYEFILRRVNIHRFQYYQMTVDIIAITWLLYYMGGIDAPVVSIAYYAIILWAGVVSSDHAVFFAVLVSSTFMTAVISLEHGGMLPHISLYSTRMPTSKLLGLLIGNISYLFAFGYFSAHSSRIIKILERKRRGDALRSAHRFAAIDHLISATSHDMLGRFNNVKACAKLLLEDAKDDDSREMLRMIVDEDNQGIELLRRLSKFSRKEKPEYETFNIHDVIDEAINLTLPVVRYSNVTVEKKYGEGLPAVEIMRDQIQEVFVALILNAMDAALEKSTLTITTAYAKEEGLIEIVFTDTGVGIKQEYLNQAQEPYFTAREYRERLGTGLSISNEIIAHHGGSLDLKSAIGGRGTTFTVSLPLHRPVIDEKKKGKAKKKAPNKGEPS